MPTLSDAVLEARLELLTLPNLLKKARRSAEDISSRVAQLKAAGYTSLGRVFSERALSTIRQEIAEAIDRHHAQWNASSEYWELNDPLCFTGMIETATQESILSVIDGYFGRSCLLADADLRRIPPRDMSEIEKKGKTSSTWHRDTRGRQVKLMIYMTDVTERDSNFAFYPASHRRRAYGFAGSRISDQEAKTLGEPTEWHGGAGDGMLFDTNIVHRLRRRGTGTVRDSVTFYYTPGQFLRRLSTSNLSLNGRQARLVHGAPWWSKRV